MSINLTEELLGLRITSSYVLSLVQLERTSWSLEIHLEIKEESKGKRQNDGGQTDQKQ